MMDNTFEKQYVYKSTLREVYGMTDSMIIELGEPDMRVKNSHYKSGPPASLYLIARVEAWCDAHRKRLDEAAKARAKRQDAARRANETKYNQLIWWAETAPITFDPPATFEAVWDEAERHYAYRQWEFGRDEYHEVTRGGVIAYMRHERTNYESLLRQLRGQVGADVAYGIIRDRVDQVCEAYLDAAIKEPVDEPCTGDAQRAG